MLRRLTLAVIIFVGTHAWAQGVFPYPTKTEIKDALKEAGDVINRFDKVITPVDIDSWNAPEVFRGRQKLLLSNAREGLDDVRDDIESELEVVNSGQRASATDLLAICKKVREVADFVENAYVYASVFQTDATNSEVVSLSELSGSAKTASIRCGGILSVQVEADEIRAKACHHQNSP
jgi:hypothetical protein